MYREAARRCVSAVAADDGSLSPALRVLLRDVGNDCEQLERLLAALLPRRDQWLRVLAGGFFIEFLLAAASVPFFASGREADLEIVVPPATLAIAFGLGAWTARRAGGRHLLHGALAGVAAVLFYLLLFAGSLLFAPGQADLEASLSPAYLASHLFKVLGAAAGGWWIARRRAG